MHSQFILNHVKNYFHISTFGKERFKIHPRLESKKKKDSQY